MISVYIEHNCRTCDYFRFNDEDYSQDNNGIFGFCLSPHSETPYEVELIDEECEHWMRETYDGEKHD